MDEINNTSKDNILDPSANIQEAGIDYNETKKVSSSPKSNQELDEIFLKNTDINLINNEAIDENSINDEFNKTSGALMTPEYVENSIKEQVNNSEEITTSIDEKIETGSILESFVQTESEKIKVTDESTQSISNVEINKAEEKTNLNESVGSIKSTINEKLNKVISNDESTNPDLAENEKSLKTVSNAAASNLDIPEPSADKTESNEVLSNENSVKSIKITDGINSKSELVKITTATEISKNAQKVSELSTPKSIDYSPPLSNGLEPIDLNIVNLESSSDLGQRGKSSPSLKRGNELEYSKELGHKRSSSVDNLADNGVSPEDRFEHVRLRPIKLKCNFYIFIGKTVQFEFGSKPRSCNNRNRTRACPQK